MEAPSPPPDGYGRTSAVIDQFKAQTYELAAPDGPPTNFGYVGYEHNGRLFSPAVTVNDLAGVTFFSTHSVSTLRRLKPFGTVGVLRKGLPAHQPVGQFEHPYG